MLVAFSYIGYDRDQLFLLPPSMREWLAEGHLALFVIDLVSLIDTAAFHEAHPNDGAGRPAYDPDLMVALLLYAYSIGMRSSRAIERSCVTDVAFRVIRADLTPDHATIARFRASNEEAIKGIFFEVLRLCGAAGMASLGRIAIDGTKMGSDASLRAKRSGEWIRSEIERILAEAGAADKEEASSPPGFFAEDLPEDLRSRGRRLERLRAALGELEGLEAVEVEAEAKRSEVAKRASTEAEVGRMLPGRKPKDPDARLARAEADVVAATKRVEAQPGRAQQAIRLAEAKSRLAEARLAADAAGEKNQVVVVHVTDPQSRIMKTRDAWVQGYNVQAAVNDQQIAIAYGVSTDHNDVGQLAPMIEAVNDAAAKAGIEGKVGLLLADARYWSEENATRPGPDRLIATTKDCKQRKAAREMGQTGWVPRHPTRDRWRQWSTALGPKKAPRLTRLALSASSRSSPTSKRPDPRTTSPPLRYGPVLNNKRQPRGSLKGPLRK